jgi:hypothetical protein
MKNSIESKSNEVQQLRIVFMEHYFYYYDSKKVEFADRACTRAFARSFVNGFSIFLPLFKAKWGKLNQEDFLPNLIIIISHIFCHFNYYYYFPFLMKYMSSE